MINRASYLFVFSTVMTIFEIGAFSQPLPGDVFREYMWYNKNGDAGEALRVGGKLGYKGHITLEHDFDLEHAVKAEAVVEKILCHDSTKGLAIQINGEDCIKIPEAKKIPFPQWEYQHHIYPTVPIPLSYLKKGSDNEFRMKVDPEHPWNWPQNLICGVHFRIYYDASKKQHPIGKIITPKTGSNLYKAVKLKVEAQVPSSEIKQVDYIGYYEDVNFEGDGNYLRWHYHFFHGKIMHHIGTAQTAPYQVTWDTSWVPDQKQPIKIAARIIDSTGLAYLTEAVADLSLIRPGISVELCKPYDVPKKWVTRSAEKKEHFNITSDVSKAVAAQLVWSSWSPGYMNGIYINGTKVFDKEGPKYQYFAHRITIDDVSPFKQGINVLMTGKTPKINGKMLHGMEVNWPGIMVLIKYVDNK